MIVFFKSNLDNYQPDNFPKNITIPPRIGEKVAVIDNFKLHFRNKQLPDKLEVVDVTWYGGRVVCELWYTDIDVKIAKENNINLF